MADKNPARHAANFLLRPFAALSPAPGRAQAIAAPPYDVLSKAEAKALAAGRPSSFLHVSRAEIDLDDGIDPYAQEVYAAAGHALDRLLADGELVRETSPAYYVYRAGNAERSQTGIAGAASVDAYASNRIRRHELTRPAKETDRVRQIEAVNAITGPVMLIHRHDATLADMIARTTGGEPAHTAEVDGWQHEVWPVTDPAELAVITTCFEQMPALYIADGHHRSAAALRVAAARREQGAGHGAHDAFLAVSFSHREVRILDYNRVVRDLNGHAAADILGRLEADFTMTRADAPVAPAAVHQFGLYLEGTWYQLALRGTPPADLIDGLDVSLLDERVLGPLFGITDPRTDPRIDFVGGSRGVAAIADRVDSGHMAAGFTLHPTRVEDLLAVADATRIMPPKSTWFEPKLADGLLSLPLD